MAFRRMGILLTEKCNYQCNHCYLSCHPQGKSLSFEYAKKIVDNFPENITVIWLSGGEPFVEKQLLYDTLGYLSSRHFPVMEKLICVRTNGFWGRDEVVAQRIINELLDLNLEFTVRLMMSYDVFHKEQGLKWEYLTRIQRMVNEISTKNEKLKVDLPTSMTTLACPIGRAISKVPKKQWWKETECVNHVNLKPDYYDLIVDFNGQVHGCCRQLPPVLGNAVNKPMAKILGDARSNRIFQLLEEKGIKEVASFLGWSKKDIERKVKEGGECWLCGKVFPKI